MRAHYNGVRLHQGIGYVCPMTSTKDADKPSARPERPASNKPALDVLPDTRARARREDATTQGPHGAARFAGSHPAPLRHGHLLHRAVARVDEASTASPGCSESAPEGSLRGFSQRRSRSWADHLLLRETNGTG